MTRGISLYKNVPFEIVAQNLKTEIDDIKNIGFDTVWFVIPWREFCPKPLENKDDLYKFKVLKDSIKLLASKGMKAMLPLNYLGAGWEPEGISAAGFITDPNMYGSFERYVLRLLTYLEDVAEHTTILVFSENTYHGRNWQTEGRKIAKDLQKSLGSLPNRLPRELRGKYKIVYHDGEFLTLGWGQGISPVASPCPFDALSMVGYISNMTSKTVQGITKSLNQRKKRFEEAHPGIPIIMGEWGASSCPDNEVYQSKKNMIVLKWAEKNLEGWSLWGWFPGPPGQDCSNPVYNGLSITRQEGDLKLSAKNIKKFINPESKPEPSVEPNSDSENGWFLKLWKLFLGIFR